MMIVQDPRPRVEDVVATLPFPTGCTACHRMYAAFKMRWGRWHIFPESPEPAHVGLGLDMSRHLEELAREQTSLVPKSVCRTTKPTKLHELAKMMSVRVEAPETNGGMARIYALEDPDKVLKVADVQRSWCKYEPRNYQRLHALGIPCSRLWDWQMCKIDDVYYVAMVLERLEFTLTAYIRAAGRVHANPKKVVGLVQTILEELRQKNLAYVDLSPDNIMFRDVGNGTFAAALIDPQFVVPLDAFAKKMPPRKAQTFDTTYVALKIQAIGMMDPEVHKFTEAVCAGVLGHVPLEKHAVRWLVHDAPVGLFMAYDILRTLKS